MSLIKEALDKVQKEGNSPEEREEVDSPPAQDHQQPQGAQQPQNNSDANQQFGVGTIITSVIIVILAALIGGQIVLLLSMFVL